MVLSAGTVLEGKVTGISNFGVFVSFKDGQSGLVHISEIASGYVKDISQHINVGQSVRVKVLSVGEGGKISLSIKQATEQEEEIVVQNQVPEEVIWSNNSANQMTFEEKMNRYKQDSEEKIHVLKRNFESKRGTSFKK